MTREDVLNVVIKHLKANVDGLEGVAIDPSRPMDEYGASSLDIVEVVSCAMRELQIKMPRTQLVSIENIDGLVDALTEARRAAGNP
jgi:acyl carrier protein